MFFQILKGFPICFPIYCEPKWSARLKYYRAPQDRVFLDRFGQISGVFGSDGSDPSWGKLIQQTDPTFGSDWSEFWPERPKKMVFNPEFLNFRIFCPEFPDFIQIFLAFLTLDPKFIDFYGLVCTKFVKLLSDPCQEKQFNRQIYELIFVSLNPKSRNPEFSVLEKRNSRILCALRNYMYSTKSLYIAGNKSLDSYWCVWDELVAEHSPARKNPGSREASLTRS